MENVEVESSSTTESGTESTSESSGGTQSTQSNSENMVPQSRFKEVVDERNLLREKIGSQDTIIEALEADDDSGETEDVSYEADTPPEGLTKDQEIRWYVRKHAGPQVQEIVERELGMSLEDARTRLEQSTETARSTEQAQWVAACATAGLDPNDKDIQGIASGLAKMHPDDNIADVLTRTAKYTGVTKKSNETTGANVEHGGVSGVMASSDWIPKNAADAAAGAKQGKRAKHRSSVEIIEARLSAKAS